MTAAMREDGIAEVLGINSQTVLWPASRSFFKVYWLHENEAVRTVGNYKTVFFLFSLL